ncbi:hypothetical protein K2173_003832 [Erythroxylum novogranatense]|uniref:Laccase n=1 Tax=Erythroxylum novogranatense TaxID=1862640 RepID=A0AAV8SJP8_9ROSI|nr:hypothetical protein K2173_003832 [Erythroxylum novogranatense]
MGLISLFVGYFFLSSLIFGTAMGAVHYYDFVLKETNFTRLCSTKSMLTVNDSFPGPEIRVRKGDTVFVNVHNRGTYGVTIHWHGVKQPRNPWSDGPENITQCPIPAGTSFTQEIALSTEEGTLWWHAHSDWSRATVHGAIIIHPAKGTRYPFPKPYEEKTIVLASWYKGDVMKVIKTAVATGGEPNSSDAFTINGQPGDLYACSNETTYRLHVRRGKTYLLRIVNAVLNEEMFFGIAKHNLTVVGQDAAYTKPNTVEYITITPGQTMDVLVTANQHAGKYYIASSAFAESGVPFDNTTTTAILQYKGKHTNSSIRFPTLPAYNDTDAAARFFASVKALASKEHPVYVPKKINRRIYMTASINTLPCPSNKTCTGYQGGIQASSLNNISFTTASVDILQAYYRNINGIFSTDFPDRPPVYFNFTGNVENVTWFTRPGRRVILLNYGEEVELVYQGTNLVAAENHPMHLHGFSFYLVGMNKGNFDVTKDPLRYNLVDPPEVNTIGLPMNGWAAVRFTADNPGVWFMHCHLERHTTWGMSSVVIVKNGGTKKTSMRPPPSYMPPCSTS